MIRLTATRASPHSGLSLVGLPPQVGHGDCAYVLIGEGAEILHNRRHRTCGKDQSSRIFIYIRMSVYE
jgi:hypothetical protein